jgi:hypothetical protein
VARQWAERRPARCRGWVHLAEHHVRTIVFAYAGAALPLLMLAEIYPRPLSTVLTGADIGEEAVRILVGVIALVLTVPLTSAVGALLATVTRPSPTEPAPGPLPPDTRPAMPAAPPVPRT